MFASLTIPIMLLFPKVFEKLVSGQCSVVGYCMISTVHDHSPNEKNGPPYIVIILKGPGEVE